MKEPSIARGVGHPASPGAQPEARLRKKVLGRQMDGSRPAWPLQSGDEPLRNRQPWFQTPHRCAERCTSIGVHVSLAALRAPLRPSLRDSASPAIYVRCTSSAYISGSRSPLQALFANFASVALRPLREPAFAGPDMDNFRVFSVFRGSKPRHRYAERCTSIGVHVSLAALRAPLRPSLAGLGFARHLHAMHFVSVHQRFKTVIADPPSRTSPPSLCHLCENPPFQVPST